MIKAGELIQPLINLLKDRLLEYPVLQCDETRLQVLNEEGKSATSTSYMWVRVGGPPTEPIRLFDYADSRAGSVAIRLLGGYRGYLQTDDYAGYNAIVLTLSILAAGLTPDASSWKHRKPMHRANPVRRIWPSA